MSLLDMVDKAFQPIVILLGAYLVLEFRTIAQNISSLNTNVAILIERTTSQREEMDRFEARLTHLETRKLT